MLGSPIRGLSPMKSGASAGIGMVSPLRSPGKFFHTPRLGVTPRGNGARGTPRFAYSPTKGSGFELFGFEWDAVGDDSGIGMGILEDESGGQGLGLNWAGGWDKENGNGNGNGNGNLGGNQIVGGIAERKTSELKNALPPAVAAKKPALGGRRETTFF